MATPPSKLPGLGVVNPILAAPIPAILAPVRAVFKPCAARRMLRSTGSVETLGQRLRKAFLEIENHEQSAPVFAIFRTFTVTGIPRWVIRFRAHTDPYLVSLLRYRSGLHGVASATPGRARDWLDSEWTRAKPGIERCISGTLSRSTTRRAGLTTDSFRECGRRRQWL